MIAKPVQLLAGSWTSRGNDALHLSLLHTNDLHGNMKAVTHHGYLRMGGFDKVSACISQLRKEKDNLLLLDAGDICCGDASHEADHNALLSGMQRAGYDAALPGNRDFEAGADYLVHQWRSSRFPLLASNYRFRNNALQQLHQPYHIVRKGALRIGILAAGIDPAGLLPASLKTELNYQDPIETCSRLATFLKMEQHCNLVVCLSHLGYQNKKAVDDLQLGARSRNIDIIIGGHSHTFMATPYIQRNADGHEVILNHAGFGGIALGTMEIGFNDSGQKNSLHFNNMLVGARNNQWVHRVHSQSPTTYPTL